MNEDRPLTTREWKEISDSLSDMIVKIAKREGTSLQAALRDVLIELRHLSDEKDLLFDHAVDTSDEVYEEEVELGMR